MILKKCGTEIISDPTTFSSEPGRENSNVDVLLLDVETRELKKLSELSPVVLTSTYYDRRDQPYTYTDKNQTFFAARMGPPNSTEVSNPDVGGPWEVKGI